MGSETIVIAQTERLTLRAFEAGDSSELFEIFSSSETMRLMPGGLMHDEATVTDWIDRRRALQFERGYSIWAVVLRASGRLIGDCGFTGERDGALEMGYVIDHRYWGQGYATEAASAAVEYGFSELKASSIVATIRPWNSPSIAVAGRLGMDQIDSTSDERGELLVFRLVK